MMQYMLISIAFCVLAWSASQVVALHWHITSIQPSPSFQASKSAVQSTPVIQRNSSLTRGHCSSGEVACRSSGQCIPYYYVCDYYTDCSDASDENNCYSSISVTPTPTLTSHLPVSSSYGCPHWQFSCYHYGQCVNQWDVCDGWEQCYDGSDEWHCASSSKIQPTSASKLPWMKTSSLIISRNNCRSWWLPQQFRCSNGQCIDQYQVCNGRYDCYDGSDEDWAACASIATSSKIQPSSTEFPLMFSSRNYCDYWQFRCRNGQCTHRHNKCDGYVDCYDGSDEDRVTCASRTKNMSASIQPTPTAMVASTSVIQCPWYRPFQCRNGRCIEKSRVCNRYNDCGDESDERRSMCRANLTICQNKLDLGFILDSSGSVGRHDFERMKFFVKDLVDFYKLGLDETRVSVMSFSDSAYINIAFSQRFSDKEHFDSVVDRIRYDDGGTATAMALNMAYNDMFTSRNGARESNFKKVLIILTDGRSNSGLVSGPARKLKNSGVVIFSVGIGQSLSMHELQVMASDPIDQHVISLANFTQLSLLAEKMSSQTCNASHFQVFCDNDYMTAVFERTDLPKQININHLYLRDRRCKAWHNSTHVTVKTPLTGCGTLFSENDQTLFFTNVLSEEERTRSYGVITRNYLFGANLTCTYPRKRTVGSFSFAPAKERLFVSASGQGNFTLTVDVFKSSSYREPYTPGDYPVFKSLSDYLYIQYSINTNNSDLVVRAETCRATATNRPYDSPQYVFIADSCDKDKTIRHYTYGMSRVQRFSIQAFRFLSQHRFVYLHCDLVVCNRNDVNSTCARSTSCSHRYRRDVGDGSGSEDVSGMYALSFGPVMESKESSEKSKGAHSEVNTTLVGSLVGFGCLSLVLIGALLYMIQRSRRRGADQPHLGVVNKEALAMENLAYS